jgi:hypothetical protein
MVIGKARIGSLMSLLESLKFCVIALSNNISEFAKINEIPIPLDIRRIDEGDRIEAALINNEEKYHESCRLMFNNTKLQRSQKGHILILPNQFSLEVI